MIKTLWTRFYSWSIYLKIIWIFCLIGTFCNALALGRDITQNAILMRLHLGFFVLYAGQVVFIVWGEKSVFWLSLLQALLALVSNLDFTFVPVVRLIGGGVYQIWGPFSVADLEVYKYVFTSVCFTLELLKTVLLFILIPKR